jgi:predicted nucleic acid-binding protein
MSASGILLIDTSAWIQVLRHGGDETLNETVTVALNENRAAMTAPVWVELYGGVKGQKEVERLTALRRLCRWLELDGECWESAAEIMRICREKGVTVPLSDVLVFACARRHDVGILERDKHFALISKAVDR